MLRIGYEYAGFATTTSASKGGEDTFNPSNERDSRRYSDDGSQGSESYTGSEDQSSYVFVEDGNQLCFLENPFLRVLTRHE